MRPSVSSCLPSCWRSAGSASSPGQANIDNDSRGLMDRLVEIALRCPTVSVEIGGHTDTDGDEEANMRLSERRAQAVLDYMLRAGLPADRLQRGRLRPDAAAGVQRHRRRQGAKSPYRIHGEVASMLFLAEFHWGWLAGGRRHRAVDGLGRRRPSRRRAVETRPAVDCGHSRAGDGQRVCAGRSRAGSATGSILGSSCSPSIFSAARSAPGCANCWSPITARCDRRAPRTRRG